MVDRNSHAEISTTARRFVLEAPTRSFWHEIDEINEIVAHPGVRAPTSGFGALLRARRARTPRGRAEHGDLDAPARGSLNLLHTSARN